MHIKSRRFSSKDSAQVPKQLSNSLRFMPAFRVSIASVCGLAEARASRARLLQGPDGQRPLFSFLHSCDEVVKKSLG